MKPFLLLFLLCLTAMADVTVTWPGGSITLTGTNYTIQGDGWKFIPPVERSVPTPTNEIQRWHPIWTPGIIVTNFSYPTNFYLNYPIYSNGLLFVPNRTDVSH